jgi:hypothetical protein
MLYGELIKMFYEYTKKLCKGCYFVFLTLTRRNYKHSWREKGLKILNIDETY